MAERKKYMHVCTSPALIDQFEIKGSIVVVIDVLRATTSMCVGFGEGVELIVPVEHEDECLAYRDKGYLIAGERSGEKIDGFDMGNSPFEFMDPRVKGAKIAMTTTNGTKAMKAAQAREAKEVVAGAFTNISTLSDWLIEQNEHICLLCSGWRDNFTLEDTIFAGAVAQRIRSHFYPYQDTTIMARTLYKSANSRKRYFFRASSHFHRLVHLNLQGDVKFAMHRDKYNVLPLLVGDELHDFAGKKQIKRAKNAILKTQLKNEEIQK
ncbi:MAG: 2-phosphosulfolactate phosphatase [Bacteroidia bacterium]